MKPDSANLLLFDTRTRAVMAATPSQDGVKELVQAVREIVPGRSNNDIILVLQYYEYDVERSIQAFLEDGAKDALQEWRSMSVNKTANKKKKKNKKTADPAPGGVSSADQKSSVTTGEPMQTKSEPQAPQVKRETKDTPSPTSVPSASNEHSKSVAKPQRASSGRRSRENSHTEPRPAKKLAAPAAQQTVSKTDSQRVKNGPVTVSVPHSTKVATQRVEKSRDAVVAVTPSGSTAEPVPTEKSNSSKEATRPKDLPGPTFEKSPSRAHHSHGVKHAQEKAHAHAVPHEEPGAKRRPHAGLEKSVKDLARQTSSLQRLKLVLDTELDKSFKKIKEVYQEARRQLSEREVVIVQHMDQLKDEAHEVLQRRQENAFELKMKVERAQTMNEEQIQELRSEIKLFVSDRKIDEDLAHTTRFLYDSDLMKEEINKFGEVVPLKCLYSTRHPSVSSLASSGVGHDEASLHSPATPTAPPASNFSSSAVQVLRQTYNVHQVNHEELADLQKRLQNSLKNKRQPSPQRKTSSAKGKEDQTKQDDSNSGQQRSRNAIRRQRKREMDREAKRNPSSDQDNSAGKNDDNKAQNKVSNPAPKSAGNQTARGNQQSVAKNGDRQSRERGPANKDSGQNSRRANQRRGRHSESDDKQKSASSPPVAREQKPAKPTANVEKQEDNAKPMQNGDVSPGDVSPGSGKNSEESVLNNSSVHAKTEDSMVNGDGQTDAGQTDANMNTTKSSLEEAQPQRKPRVRGDRNVHMKSHATSNGPSLEHDAIKANGDVIPNGCCDGDGSPSKPIVGKVGDDITDLVIEKSSAEVLQNGDAVALSES